MPPPGNYNVEAAENLIRSKSPAVVIRPALNLYSKQTHNPSVRPESKTDHIKPFGADVKGKIDMGSKYENKINKYPTPRNMDYDAALAATKPKVPGGGFAPPKVMDPAKVKGTFKKTPKVD